LHDINRYHVLVPGSGDTWNVGALRTISWLGAEPADVWLSVDGGGSYELLETGAGGASSNSISLRVPHLPTRFARVQISPSDPSVSGRARSDSLFTIQSSVLLLSLQVEPGDEGTTLTWATDPGVGPEGLLGYRLYRIPPGGTGSGVRIGPELIVDTSYRDSDPVPGSIYRLMAVNGFDEELLLAEAAQPPRAPLAAWPLPYRGGELTIAFATASELGGGPAAASVGIYDVTGRLVRTVARGNYPAGMHYTTWDGIDDRGQKAAAGTYFLRSRSAGREKHLKLVVVR
jgi:hypothetical protein